MLQISARKFVFTGLLLLGSGLLSLVALEVTLRMLPIRNSVDQPKESAGYHQDHATRGYDIKPNVTGGSLSFYGHSFPIWSNTLGCFDREYDGEKPFVYLAGDSFTWGYAAFEDKWGTLLEQALGMRVLKCAVTATGTYHQYLKALDVLTQYQHPKLIIVGYFTANDVHDDAAFPGFVVRQGVRFDNPTPGKLPTDEVYQEVDRRIRNYKRYCMIEVPQNRLLQAAKCWFTKNSVLYVLSARGVKTSLHSILPENIVRYLGVDPVYINGSIFPSATDTEFEKHFTSIRLFQQLAEEQGSRLLFVLIPSREEIYPELFGAVDSEKRDRVRAYLDTLHIPYVDMYAPFLEVKEYRSQHDIGSPGDLYWPVEFHIAPLGNEVIAKYVMAYIEEHGLVSDAATINVPEETTITP